MNPALRGLTLSGASEVARYTAYADDVSMLVTSSAKVEEVSKEIGRYKAVTGAKINREKSVGLVEKLVLFPAPSASGSGLIFSWRKIGRKYWKRS